MSLNPHLPQQFSTLLLLVALRHLHTVLRCADMLRKRDKYKGKTPNKIENTETLKRMFKCSQFKREITD